MLESNRLKLRCFEEGEFDTYVSWINTKEVQFDQVKEFFIPRTKEHLREAWENIFLHKKSFCFAIEIKESKKLIGFIQFTQIDLKNQQGEFAIQLGELGEWGKGYGKEAMKILIEFGFKELNLHHIWGQVISMNERALGLYKSLGFKEEGRLREHIWRNGKRWDLVFVGLLDHEFNQD